MDWSLVALVIGVLPGLSQAAEPPAWLDQARFERLLEEVPLSPDEEVDEAESSKAPQGDSPTAAQDPAARPGKEVDARASQDRPGVFERGPHHQKVRQKVDRKRLENGRKDRLKALEKEIKDFEKKHKKEVKGLALESRLSDKPSETEWVWLSLHVERQELEDEIRSLKKGDPMGFQEHTEMEAGAHYWSARHGRWRRSKAEIEIIDGIGGARQGQQKVLFAPDLTEEGSIDISTPDGKRLKATVIGLAYVDASSGKDLILGKVRSTRGEVVGRNQMIYRDAFEGVEADVVYTYRKSGLEQEIVLRAKIPSPDQVGLDPESTRLEVMTEWFDVPEPIVLSQSLRERLSKDVDRGSFAEPTVMDESLSFGKVEIGLGRAFWREGEGGSRAKGKESKLRDLPIGVNGLPAGLEHDLPNLMYPMAKHWLVQDGRTVLCEGVEYRSIESLIARLPGPKKRRAGTAFGDAGRIERLAANDHSGRLLPGIKNGNGFSLDEGGVHLARAESVSSMAAPGLVLDYRTINPATDFRFKAGETYRVTGDVVLSGTTVIEGGAVIKFERSTASNPVQIRCLGVVECETGPYNPAVFTAVGDFQYGSRLSYEPVSGYYAKHALWIEPGGAAVNIEYLRIKHAQNGIFFENSEGAKLQHGQILGCEYPVATRYQDLEVQNVLIDDFGRYAFWAMHSWPPVEIMPGEEVNVHATHVTVNNGPWLAWNSHWRGNMGTTEFRNSLLVNVNGGWINGRFYPGDIGDVFINSPFVPNTSQSAVFESAAYGNFYLPAGSPYRDAGGENIDPVLAVELRQKTTTAPTIVQGFVSGACTLAN